MPGYMLHLTAAQMYLEKLRREAPGDPLSSDPDGQDQFYIGNLLPDSVNSRAEKAASHFRDPRYRDRMMEWPHPDRFAEKYAERMAEPVFRGYHFHLYIDRRFFRDYIPRVVSFLDAEGRETEKREEIREVLIRKSGERTALSRYLSEEYYYGDYTRMNAWLGRHYPIPDRIGTGPDPGIEEADHRGLQRIFLELERYGSVPLEAAEKLKVFDLEDLIRFLEEAAGAYV